MHRQTLRELAATAAYQRKILMAAVQLVRPGGTLVFSTCSINPGVGGGVCLAGLPVCWVLQGKLPLEEYLPALRSAGQCARLLGARGQHTATTG